MIIQKCEIQMEDLTNYIEKNLTNQRKIVNGLFQHKNEIKKIVELLIRARNNGKIIYTMGNGGSSSTASHFSSDLLKTAIMQKEKRFKSISLVDNFSVISAWSNDDSYDNIFSEQIENFVTEGDIIICFSGSGKSKNIVKALQMAKKKGGTCIGITGMTGGMVKKICDVTILIDSNDMLTIESIHLMLCHCFISVLRNMGKPLFDYT